MLDAWKRRLETPSVSDRPPAVSCYDISWRLYRCMAYVCPFFHCKTIIYTYYVFDALVKSDGKVLSCVGRFSRYYIVHIVHPLLFPPHVLEIWISQKRKKNSMCRGFVLVDVVAVVVSVRSRLSIFYLLHCRLSLPEPMTYVWRTCLELRSACQLVSESGVLHTWSSLSLPLPFVFIFKQKHLYNAYSTMLSVDWLLSSSHRAARRQSCHEESLTVILFEVFKNCPSRWIKLDSAETRLIRLGLRQPFDPWISAQQKVIWKDLIRSIMHFYPTKPLMIRPLCMRNVRCFGNASLQQQNHCWRRRRQRKWWQEQLWREPPPGQHCREPPRQLVGLQDQQPQRPREFLQQHQHSEKSPNRRISSMKL